MNKEKIYYHYCSMDAFFNIVNSGTLRFGNLLCMNDSTEIIWLLKMVKEYLLINKSQYMKLLSIWDKIEKATRDFLQEIDFPYVFCLSKNRDILSQWRSYADDGHGIAIGFNVSLLEDNIKLKGEKIIYNKEEQQKLLDEKMKKELYIINNYINEKEENDIINKSRRLFSYIAERAIVCKNPTFREEEEYRISCKSGNFENDKIKISNIKFRPGKSSIVPYVEVDFSKIKNYLIKRIVLGPKCVANGRNLWLFMKENGFKWNEERTYNGKDDKIWKEHVLISQSSYR